MVDPPPHFFISHAHEDKDVVARPLFLALRRRGLSVWYDEFSLRIGDSLRESIDRGLTQSRFGIVILSRNFFAKRWTEAELSALYERQLRQGSKVILPVLHDITHGEVAQRSSLLANIVATSTRMGIPEVVDDILTTTGLMSSAQGAKGVLRTGIKRLDDALGGGLPGDTSIVLVGPKGIGKTTLGLQIQIAALDRNEPCLFIAYRDPPYDILKKMLEIGAPVADYVKSGKFRIFDSFSALNGLTSGEAVYGVPDELHEAVVRVEDPADPEQYYQKQVSLMEKIGYGGVNVIDSANERFRMMPDLNNAMRYFQRFRTRISGQKRQSAIHIVSELPEHEHLVRNLINDQNGIIRMRYEGPDNDRRRELRIESIREVNHDSRWMEFFIGQNGIEIIDFPMRTKG